MEPFQMEAAVGEGGALVLTKVPFPPGTKLVVTLEEAEPMDREAFEAALRAHYAGGVE